MGRGEQGSCVGERRRSCVAGVRQRRRYQTQVVVRGEIWPAALDPTVGSEIRKTRPCVVVSPPQMHDYLRTVIVAPMTTGSKPAPFRVPIAFAGKRGLIVLDQVRTLDKARLIRRLGRATEKTIAATLSVLQEMFAK
jgi:mRNA interferase MazF